MNDEITSEKNEVRKEDLAHPTTTPEKDVVVEPVLSIDRAQIPEAELADEVSDSTRDQLQLLGVSAYNAADVEQNVLKQVDKALSLHEQKQQQILQSTIMTPHRSDIEKTEKEIKKIEAAIKMKKNQYEGENRDELSTLQQKLSLKKKSLDDLKKKENMFLALQSKKNQKNTAASQKTSKPFQKGDIRHALYNNNNNSNGNNNNNNSMNNNVNNHKNEMKRIEGEGDIVHAKRKALESGFDPFDAALDAAESERANLINTGKITPFQSMQGFSKTRKEEFKKKQEEEEKKKKSAEQKPKTTTKRKAPEPKYTQDHMDDIDWKEEQEPEEDEDFNGEDLEETATPKRKRIKKPKDLQESWRDDADDNAYSDRIIEWKQRTLLERKPHASDEEEQDGENGEGSDGQRATHQDVTYDGGFTIPGKIYESLFEYQITGVQWMWELHCQSAGGIIGDEMGLGKTVQTISFLASLHHSKLLDGPTLVICPATVMQQWVNEFHKWWPPFRVALLHDSSSYKGKKKDIIKKMAAKRGGVLITTYESVRINSDKILKYHWEYVVLDEGHKIRNPDAAITLSMKRFTTPHRLILTGAPIQNNLTELWSIFDFVFPGKLGTLPAFQNEFAQPITTGGYANASPVQIQTAYKCAVALRDLINPYLLRRLKANVQISLPQKSEQVLFCNLSEEQREAYQKFLKSDEVTSILDGKRNVLFGIDILRKICNHPDLLLRQSPDKPDDYGYWERSGKLKVLEQLLPLWKEKGHKVLLFAQTRQMLDIIESFVTDKGFQYVRMDGNTAVRDRMYLVENFNNNEDLFVFLLSTKVGGLGLNLVGADRVIIFDPDWNPSTDIQARERAWRIGQKKDVTIYRLMTSGTIEEKIYHRQIFKQFLTDKILKNPQQHRLFKFRHLRDLFTLGNENSAKTETEEILDMNFKGSKDQILLRPGSSSDEEIHNSDKDEIKEEEGEEEQPKSRKDEAFILRKLFDGQDGINGIKGAISHDKLVDDNPLSHEYKMAEETANQIAQKALDALTNSRRQCRREDISVPTWTGKSGAAGAPGGRRFGNKSASSTSSAPIPTADSPPKAGFSQSAPVSSQDLLSHINEQTRIINPRQQEQFMEKNRESMIGDLYDFLMANGGAATTEEIVNRFKLKIGKEEAVIFRSMLKKIATFYKTGKFWKLNDFI